VNCTSLAVSHGALAVLFVSNLSKTGAGYTRGLALFPDGCERCANQSGRFYCEGNDGGIKNKNMINSVRNEMVINDYLALI
jgi:hypothetical protein